MKRFTEGIYSRFPRFFFFLFLPRARYRVFHFRSTRPRYCGLHFIHAARAHTNHVSVP